MTTLLLSLKNFIALIPNDIKIWIVTNNKQSIGKRSHKFSHKNIDFIGLRGWDEIWLRDCIGFVKGDSVMMNWRIMVMREEKPIFIPQEGITSII